MFWFRRDLRLEDNTGLHKALVENERVVPLFIFDTTILDKLEDPADARVTFIHNCLVQLQEELAAAGSSLLILHGNPVELFRSLAPKAVYTNHDYEPYGRQRDEMVKKELAARGIPFHSVKDQVVFEKDEVVKADGTPYSVFTPYSKRWLETFRKHPPVIHPTSKFLHHLAPCKALPIPTLADLGFTRSSIEPPPRRIPQRVIEKYADERDFPGMQGTTRLGVHLRFGTVSIRKLVKLAHEKSTTWLNELIWREFYHMILWHFPYVAGNSFKPAYDRIDWRNNEEEFGRWCDGMTGYPMVDAGMRELNATGFMHNRARMITASFLTKHLLIDWRWGEAYFAKKLLDFDLAANNGGWQWAAGSGCDAAPYFRVFNPTTQMEKFDPEVAYVRRWVPELGSVNYPRPIVDHAFARQRILKVYAEALR